ncbi:inorganic diphosphatase [uncultured Dokdonia sp.]|uniref:inorganic diphosphatase n=1 Tax=uncultured Dokdonia sp. TaxID=575653 RepID=UPI0026186B64|nr:inorganic diphosphatase [uncultured Dokdonia sp.]
MIKRTLYILLIAFLHTNCTPKDNIYTTPTFSKNGTINCVIEIPGGTNKKIEFNPKTHLFEIDQRDGKDRIISFLPYPANYGFIPSTHSDPAKGGDGDALDILLLSEAVPTGSIVEVIPIAMLKLLDNGEFDYKIICIPSDPKKRIIDASTYTIFSEKYIHAKNSIESWFLHYDTGGDKLISKGWGDEEEALKEITKSVVLKNEK